MRQLVEQIIFVVLELLNLLEEVIRFGVDVIVVEALQRVKFLCGIEDLLDDLEGQDDDLWVVIVADQRREHLRNAQVDQHLHHLLIFCN